MLYSYQVPAPAAAPGPPRVAPSVYQTSPAPFRNSPAPWMSAPAAYRLSGVVDTLTDTGRVAMWLGLGAIAIIGAVALWQTTTR
jgi:hypothetical protein